MCLSVPRRLGKIENREGRESLVFNEQDEQAMIDAVHISEPVKKIMGALPVLKYLDDLADVRPYIVNEEEYR